MIMYTILIKRIKNIKHKNLFNLFIVSISYHLCYNLLYYFNFIMQNNHLCIIARLNFLSDIY
jgi:hypothetical protein